jgi:hypothetical protein
MEMNHHPQNIFTYATRELSHSAFWAWVLAHAAGHNSSYRSPTILARRLLEKMRAPLPETSIDVRTEKPLEGRVGRVDIWGLIDDEFEFVIENKKTASPRKKQIENYVTSVEHRGKAASVALISTAFDLDVREYVMNDDRWTFFTAEALDSLFAEIDCDHPIVSDYHVWLAELTRSRRHYADLSRSDRPDDLKKGLKSAVGQWALLESVSKDMSGRQYRGTNVGGRPWTQFRFVEADDKGPDAIFFRVDEDARGFYLSVRQYQSKPKPNVDEKRKRLRMLRELWNEAVDEAKVPLAFETPSNRGKKESEIAVLIFARNSPKEVIRHIPQVYRHFVPRLEKAYGSRS